MPTYEIREFGTNVVLASEGRFVNEVHRGDYLALSVGRDVRFFEVDAVWHVVNAVTPSVLLVRPCPNALVPSNLKKG